MEKKRSARKLDVARALSEMEKHAKDNVSCMCVEIQAREAGNSQPEEWKSQGPGIQLSQHESQNYAEPLEGS